MTAKASQMNDAVMFLDKLRKQKCDLLSHLLHNSNRSNIVCGRQRVGKTTLLKSFVDAYKFSTCILELQATEDSSFAAIEKSLQDYLLLQGGSGKLNSLVKLLAQLNEQRRQFVVVIDDAGKLEPGLMAKLLILAEQYQCLKMVFSLNNEELKQKKLTDPEIERCHIITLPVLSETQCAKFFPDNSVQTGSCYESFIRTLKIQALFYNTGGMPGNILTAINGASKFSITRQYKYFLIAAVIIMVTYSAMFYSLLGQADREPGNEKISIELDLERKIRSPVLNMTNEQFDAGDKMNISQTYKSQSTENN